MNTPEMLKYRVKDLAGSPIYAFKGEMDIDPRELKQKAVQRRTDPFMGFSGSVAIRIAVFSGKILGILLMGALIAGALIAFTN